MEKDILSGKGKIICGNKHCNVDNEPLHSYEVNMTYSENENGSNVTKQALVKVNLC